MGRMKDQDIDRMNAAADRKDELGSRARRLDRDMKRRPATDSKVSGKKPGRTSTQRGTSSKRPGDIGRSRDITRQTPSQRAARTGTVADPNSQASAKIRGEATKRRMKRTTSAHRTAVRKAAAQKATRKAAIKAGAKMAARAVPAAGAAMMVADAVGAVRRKTRAATPPKRPAMKRAGREQYRGKKR